MQINYIKGDATEPIGSDIKILVHICNDIGGWGKGFVMALSKKWKTPELAYRAWYKSGIDFNLGDAQFVKINDALFVCNLIGQEGIYKKNGLPPVRYEAIEKGLSKVAIFANKQEATVHMPRIGAGLAGGKWEIIEEIIIKTLIDAEIQVTVYDL
jgi:O-acetyl-ADP-ribose deacetylase (regulator of RNase III)